MILDTLDNAKAYPLGSAWTEAMAFLSALGPDTEEGEYPIRGKDVFARVMRYETRAEKDAVLETHREYVDIQTVLEGREDMVWHPAETLEAETAYDPEKDAQFYRHPNVAPAQFTITPGTFAVFFPWDGHMPSLRVDGQPEWVKKVVVKIRIGSLEMTG